MLLAHKPGVQLNATHNCANGLGIHSCAGSPSSRH